LRKSSFVWDWYTPLLWVTKYIRRKTMWEVPKKYDTSCVDIENGNIVFDGLVVEAIDRNEAENVAYFSCKKLVDENARIEASVNF
jgi:hypothetical protein